MQTGYEKVQEFLESKGIKPDESWWSNYKGKIMLFKKRADTPEITRPKQIKNELESLKKKSEELRQVIENMSTQAETRLCLAGSPDDNSNFDRPKKIKKHLEWLINNAGDVAESFGQARDGRPKAFWRKQLILTIALAWEKASGKKPTINYDAYRKKSYSPFLDFLKLSCQLAQFKYHSSDALAKEAQRVISTNKTFF